MRRWIYTLPLAAPICMLLSSCGSSSIPEPLSATSSERALVSIPQDVSTQTARVVRAGKPGAALRMQYNLASKPQIGMPVSVRVTFEPIAAADAFTATFSGMDGIGLSGRVAATFDAVQSGELQTHEFTVMAERTGVFYITVNTSMRSGAASMARTFAIPIVVGTQTRAKPTPQRDANGQPIEPMKAEEPT
jgi:hypothetical protein